jgi:hypothetical protein
VSTPRACLRNPRQIFGTGRSPGLKQGLARLRTDNSCGNGDDEVQMPIGHRLANKLSRQLIVDD